MDSLNENDKITISQEYIDKSRDKIKSSIRKVDLEYSLGQLFTDINNEIMEMKDFSLENINMILEKLKFMCETHTDNYCRKVWSKWEENNPPNSHEACKNICSFYDICIQNPDNQNDNNMFYNMCLVWKKMRYLSKYEFLNETIINEIKQYIKNMNDNKNNLNDWNNKVSNWSSE